MQSGKYRSPGNHQTQTRPLDSQRKEICHSREYISTALQSSGGWLSCCCSQLLPLCYNTTNS
ncbi:unnamed protein product [Staurois parvus]|uniref:Uncharacterized protein n=1 Tax=Staurois parvus TaxID=386267 RepID=A0ABN9H7X6_9NEOB|nr:unnamed protein product [Staurois parvus]